MRRALFLARLASRYARRHKGQTVRAILGLLVATTVLMTGLGLGESIAGSLEHAALAQLGPVDVTVRAASPFEASLADRLAQAAPGAAGAASMTLTGSVVHPRTGLAEAFATVRGVAADEPDALGPLPAAGGGALGEPGPGEVVLSSSLAERLDAQAGDVVQLRVPPPDARANVDVDFIQMAGVAAPTNATPSPHTLDVRPNALGLGAEVSWTVDADGPVRVEAQAPSGIVYANESQTSPVRLVVEPPVEEGAWTVRVVAARPVPYAGGAGVAYPPPDVTGGIVVVEARVAGIAESEGRASITGRPAAIVPLADLQRAFDARGMATDAYYRVTGDPYEAVAAMRAALPEGERDDFEVLAVKADLLANAEEAGAEVTGFLLVMGAFTLLASILLAFTLFSALVEERRAELGIARALGMTRGEVAFAMTLEGALYAAAAALAGVLVGLGILAGILWGIDTASAARGGPAFLMRVSPATLAASFLTGSLLPVATIGFASLRFARLDPARAIRGIPDDPKQNRRTGLVVAAVLVLAGAFLSWGAYSRLVGVPILLAGVAAALVAFGRPRWAALPVVAAFGHVGWTLYAVNDWPSGELDPILTLARGAVLALGVAALAVASPRPYGAVARLVAGGRDRSRVSLVALRYLVSRRRPVGLTMAMIALVVVVVTVMGTLFVVFGGTIPEHEAGYAVLGEAPVRFDALPRPLPDDLEGIERVDVLPRHVGFRQAEVTRVSDASSIHMEAGSRQFLGVTPAFAEGNRYQLADRAGAYATDRAAWDAVARGEAVIFPDWALRRNGIEVGERLVIDAAQAGPREVVVAGAYDGDFVWQTYVSADHVRAMGFPTGTRVFVRVAEDADPNEVAHRLSGAYAQDGLTFASIPEEVATVSANVQALVLVFEAFLALGLFVGLAATGFLAQRAVRERMRDIGTLRALGFEEVEVKRLFMLESTLTAAVGLAIGTLVGLLVAHSVWWREVRGDGVAFQPPLVLLAVFAVAVLGLAALASRGPARRAAALAPAMAVRHVE